MSTNDRLTAEEWREAFTKSLQDAMEEADRDGTFTAEEVLAEMDAIIEAAEAKAAEEANEGAS